MIPVTQALLIVRLTHTGVGAGGRPNLSSVQITDADVGYELQTRKSAVYVPVGGFIELPLTSRTLYSLNQGNIAGFVQAGLIRADLFVRLRDFSDKGGLTKTGVNLALVNPNIERTSSSLRIVLPSGLEAGFIPGERVTISGLSAGYADLNETYRITEVKKNEDLLGPNFGAFLVTLGLPSGPTIPPAQLGGVLLTLPDGKVTVELSGSGHAGGLGPQSHMYVGGSANVVQGIDPIFLQLCCTDGSDVPNNALFADHAGDWYIKTKTGSTIPIAGGGAAVWGSITGTLSSQNDLNTALAGKASNTSPVLSGTPTAPTAPPGTNSQQIATTQFVQTAVASLAPPPGPAGQVQISNGVSWQSAQLTSSNVAGFAYVHTQAAPSSNWSVIHNLGRQPMVQLSDILGRVFVGDIQHVNNNVFTVNLASAIAGTARCM